MNLNLTLSMIVKNEERYLKECLESVKDIADEIVLVDTGSTDNTINIAKEYGAKIFHFKWINDFSAARNYALAKSKGVWILYLDADERLSEKSKEELRKIISTKEKAAYYCYVKSLDETRGTPSVMKYPRLFKNSKKIKFEGKVHEQILNSLLLNKYIIKESSIEIIHLGYNIPKEELDKKAQRNLSLLLEEYQKHKTSYLAFQIAQSYGIQNDKINAVRFYLEMLSINDQCPEAYKAHAYRYLAAFELDYGSEDKAYQYYQEGLKFDETHALLRYVGSQIYFKKENYQAALNEALKAVNYNEELLSGEKIKEFDFYIDPEDFIILGLRSALKVNDVTSFEILMNKLLWYKKIDIYNLIKDCYNGDGSSIKIEPQEYSKFLIDLLIDLIEFRKDFSMQIRLLDKLINLFGINARIAAVYGIILYENKSLEKAEYFLKEAINLGSMHPTVRFYLIGLYASKGNFKEIKKIIETTERDFVNNNEVLEKLFLIKQKII